MTTYITRIYNLAERGRHEWVFTTRVIPIIQLQANVTRVEFYNEDGVREVLILPSHTTAIQLTETPDNSGVHGIEN